MQDSSAITAPLISMDDLKDTERDDLTCAEPLISPEDLENAGMDDLACITPLITKKELEDAGWVNNTSATSLISSGELCKEVSQENKESHDSCLVDVNVNAQVDQTNQQVDSSSSDRKGLEAAGASKSHRNHNRTRSHRSQKKKTHVARIGADTGVPSN